MDELFLNTARRAIKYLNELPGRHVAPHTADLEKIREFDEPLSESGVAPESIIEQLDRIGGPASLAMAGPRFFGFIIGGTIPVSIAANWLATAWDQATGIYRVTPAVAELESISLRWLLELLGLPPECAGGFVTGATVANFTALAAARQVVLEKVGWDVEANGLIGAPKITIIVGEEIHPSVVKALGMLGLGRKNFVRVPVDDQGRLQPDCIPEFSGPTIVCAQVGNVNTGAFDPIGEIADRVRPHGAWLHVDGAFGLWAAASPNLGHLTDGIEKADSWATDAHKWLNVPYDCGLTFVRNSAALEKAMSVTAEYLPTETPNRNPSDFTPELSRRARGVEIWATLKHLGRQGVADMIDRGCRHAQMFANGLAAAGFEILNDVVLNQVLVSFGAAEKTNRVIEAVQKDGTCWCGGTVWQGKTAMRISTSNWMTTDDDVDISIRAIVTAAKQA